MKYTWGILISAAVVITPAMAQQWQSYKGQIAGGEVVVTGTPENVAACKASHTGRFLKAHLRG